MQTVVDADESVVAWVGVEGVLVHHVESARRHREAITTASFRECAQILDITACMRALTWSSVLLLDHVTVLSVLYM